MTANPTTQAPLRAAVIGAGKISDEHLRTLTRFGRANVVGVCDLSPAMAKFAAGRWGAPAWFTDYRAMLSATSPQVVHVLTPPHTHMALVRDCLEAGAHVIVEKPAAPTGAELAAMLADAARCKRRVIENHNYKFNRAVRRIVSLVRDGALGEVCEVEARMSLGVRAGGRYADENLPHPSHRLPAGVLHEFVPHLAYLALLFMPSVDRVAACWSNHGGGPNDRLFLYDDLDAVVIGGTTHARIRYSCRTGPDCFTLMVRGTKGWAETDLWQPYLRVNVPRMGGKNLSPLVNHVAHGRELIRAGFRGFFDKVMQRTPYEGLAVFLEGAYGALQDGIEAPVTPRDMERTAALIDAMLAEGARR